MHQVFLIAEIARHIVDLASHDDKVWHGRRYQDLLNIALTCKALSGVALDALWAKVVDLDNILRLLPDLEGAGDSSLTITEAFLRNSRRVKELDLGHTAYRRKTRAVSAHASLDDLHAFCKQNRVDLFPRLHSVTIRHREWRLAHAAVFITSHLTFLSINDVYDIPDRPVESVLPTTQDLVHSLIKASPSHLTTLRIRRLPLDVPLLARLPELPSLQEVSILLTASAGKDRNFLHTLNRVWQMPSLTGLHILYGGPTELYQPEGPLLVDANLLVSDQTLIGPVRATTTMIRHGPNARTLDIVATELASSEDWDAALTAVFEHSTQTMQTLSVQKDIRWPDLSTMTPLPAAIMLTMPRYDNIQTLVLNIPLDWTDSIVDHVARSCPAITVVDIGNEIKNPRLTSASLVSLAVECLKLESFTAVLSSNNESLMRGWEALPRDFAGNPILVKLAVQLLPVPQKRNQKYYALLRKLFPNRNTRLK
ncbi:hypothetical protein PUNSTDRAFT_128833 [Punctularia strigosozonata HHB-11173 SS5]|uniref:uncharacterized protein n=1 Tax=Punctularia strigosozonata (strain HHB-11173) TaxID=741275 RepID=UPI00044172C1|nr:uncharacterized protein PUNSTDRAFT_128833 [Punctularia strigosozonata HHB-11173 SS5]EIN13149.1 hypothetical protein PUNSTDRAFT_128833 [Punctularia strigosozonata HHB-11173 SS5]